ncbi:hypothetical protein IQ230_13290 [Gloeocapsopsis crepidinum LEGE 06123]|uniref:Uncharacterized protein n=1 Tax=Gloeocapsopsis crepidinum LEGE 06123 TaxID=588587 RepID=A0ABR9UTD8_9CHRO|nr:hypothetical protein [Gloeocapsopsis crepidinum]MBE9191308.1 hypothetical protein [Gloeocapsopsis crepidinum LEGE 06123]
MHDSFTAADKDILKGDIGMSQGSLVLQSWLEVSQLFRVSKFRGQLQKLRSLEDEIRADLDALEGLLG